MSVNRVPSNVTKELNSKIEKTRVANNGNFANICLFAFAPGSAGIKPVADNASKNGLEDFIKIETDMIKMIDGDPRYK